MTQEQKTAEVAKYLTTKGIIMPADVKEEISNMAKLLADAEAEAKGLVTEVDKAYAVMEYELGKNSQPPTDNQPITPANPAPTVSAAEMLGIQKALLKQKDNRKNVSANSSIEKYIFDRPAPSEIIPKNATGIIDEKTWAKIEEKYEGKVLPDETDGDNPIKSTTNYNILKAAAANKTPVEVYIGELNTRAIGYIASLGTEVGNATKSAPVTRESMQDFLVMNTDGFILATETTPGVRLRYVQPKPDPKQIGKMKPGKSVLADANKKKAVESGNYVISKEIDQSVEMSDKLAKSALCFKVQTDKKKSNGQGYITKTVRVSVKTKLPTLSRKAEFAELFPDSAGNSNLTQLPSAEMANNISLAQQHAIAELRAKLGDPNEYMKVQKFESQLKAFDAAPAEAAPNVVI